MIQSVLTLIAPHDKKKLRGQPPAYSFIVHYGWLLIPALMLGSCTTEQSWMKQGSTVDDYNRDSATCRTAATRAYSRNDLPSDIHARIDACMQGRGWHKVNTAEAEQWSKASPARTLYFTNVKAALDEHAAEKHRCEKKVAAKAIASFTAFSHCADKNIGAIFERHNVPAEIAEKIRAKNMELATMLDARQITLLQADKDAGAYTKQVLLDAAPQ